MIVIDTSYALALVMPDEARPQSVATVFNERLLAPPIWPLEVANAMRSGVRRGRLQPAEVRAVCERLDVFGIAVAASAHAQPLRHFDLSRLHELTPYDASFIDLALQYRCALATLDTGLAAAAQRAGLTVHS